MKLRRTVVTILMTALAVAVAAPHPPRGAGRAGSSVSTPMKIHPATRYRHAAWLLALIAVLGPIAACSELSAESSVGGSVQLDQALEVDPFYNPIIEQALIDSRLLSSRPLIDFDPPEATGTVVPSSVMPIGQLDELRVGTWSADDDELGEIECFGYSLGSSSGARCGDDPPQAGSPEIFFEVNCREGDPAHWWVYTVDERVDALRLNFEADVAVVGDDPLGTGLVAAEGIGTLVGAAAQTTTGQVWSLAITGATCPTG